MVNKQKLNNRKTEAVISEEGSIKWFVVSIQVDRLLIWPKKKPVKRFKWWCMINKHVFDYV